MTGSRVSDRASRATRALEHTWKELRSLYPQPPTAVLVILSASARRWSLGEFSGASWRYRREANAHEVGVSPDLFRNHGSLLESLLHEAAHAILYEEDGTGGCGADRYYHLKTFRNTCRELGLECEFHNNRYGWCITHWPSPGGPPTRYRRILSHLRRNMPLGTGREVPEKAKGRPTPKSGHIRLVCACDNRQRCIYVNKTVLKQKGIICETCKSPFRPAN